MKQQSFEFFKLDEIDRDVFFWLIDRVKSKAIKSWIDYIEEEYRAKSITINSNLLFKEALKIRQDRFVNELTKNNKLPSNIELTLQLIREELKCRKFFNSLTKLGLHDSHYQPNLDNLIMVYVGLSDNTDQTYEFYYSTIETHSEQIDETRESVIEQAQKVYIALSAEVRRREKM